MSVAPFFVPKELTLFLDLNNRTDKGALYSLLDVFFVLSIPYSKYYGHIKHALSVLFSIHTG